MGIKNTQGGMEGGGVGLQQIQTNNIYSRTSVKASNITQLFI